MASIKEIRWKTDFKFYVEDRLHIPYSEDKYIITNKHREVVETVQDNDFTVIKAYRGFGKSELISFCYVLWRAEMWNESSIILSANEDLAFQKLDFVRTACEFDNINLFYLCSKKVDGMIWNRGEIWLIDSKSEYVSDDGKKMFRIKAKIYAKGLFSNFRGIHVHNIIGDDIVVEDNSLTPDNRDQTKRRFLAAAMGMRLAGNKKSHVIVVGTPQHPDDLLQEISSKKDKDWAKCIIPVYNAHGLPNCPELHSNEWIETQRKIIKEAIFKQEYMLETELLTKDFFGEQYLEKSKNPLDIMVLDYTPNKNEIIIMGVDFSIIEDKRYAEQKDTDYFSICVMSYNKITGKRKIINLYRERGLTKTAQLNFVRLFEIKYNVSRIGLETPGFLSWARQDLEERTLSKLYDTTSSKGKFDLGTGIPSLQYEFEKGMYDLPYGDDYSKTIINVLINELKNLGKEHDDVADSVLRAERVIQNEFTYTIKVEKDWNIYSSIKEVRNDLQSLSMM